MFINIGVDREVVIERFFLYSCLSDVKYIHKSNVCKNTFYCDGAVHCVTTASSAPGSSSGSSSDDDEEGEEAMTAKNFLKKEAVPEANKFLKGAKGSGVRTHTHTQHARTFTHAHAHAHTRTHTYSQTLVYDIH